MDKWIPAVLSVMLLCFSIVTGSTELYQGPVYYSRFVPGFTKVSLGTRRYSKVQRKRVVCGAEPLNSERTSHGVLGINIEEELVINPNYVLNEQQQSLCGAILERPRTMNAPLHNEDQMKQWFQKNREWYSMLVTSSCGKGEEDVELYNNPNSECYRYVYGVTSDELKVKIREKYPVVSQNYNFHTTMPLKDVPLSESAKKVYPNRNMEYILNKVLDGLTIRNIPIMTVLQELYDGSGVKYPIAVVGGFVRDVIQGNIAAARDVDLATSMPYNAIVRNLKRIFGKYGATIDDSVLHASGLRKRYGMIKVDKVQPINGQTSTESDNLDIGPMKVAYSGKDNRYTTTVSGEYVETNDVIMNHYLYGYSYLQDQGFRDFTFNSLYVEYSRMDTSEGRKHVFTFVDPTGTGLFDLRTSILRLVSQNEFFEKDLGGWFRYWRFLSKERGFVPSDRTDVEKLCYRMNICLDSLLKSGYYPFMEFNAKDFLLKLRKKRINSDGSNTRSQLLDMKETMTKYATVYNLNDCVAAWDKITKLPTSPAVEPYVNNLNGDIQEEYTLSDMIIRLRSDEMKLTSEELDIGKAKSARKIQSVHFNETIGHPENRHVANVHKYYFTGFNKAMISDSFYTSSNDESEENFSEIDDVASRILYQPYRSDMRLLFSQKEKIINVHRLILLLSPVSSLSQEIADLQISFKNRDMDMLNSGIYMMQDYTAATRAVSRMYSNFDKYSYNLAKFRDAYSANDTKTVELWNMLADMYLKVSPTYIPVHSVVLESFIGRNLDATNDNILDLGNITTNTASSLLDMVYKGIVPEDEREYQELVQIAADIGFDIDNSVVASGSSSRVDGYLVLFYFSLLLLFL